MSIEISASIHLNNAGHNRLHWLLHSGPLHLNRSKRRHLLLDCRLCSWHHRQLEGESGHLHAGGELFKPSNMLQSKTQGNVCTCNLQKKLSTIPIGVCTCRGTDLARWCLIFFKRHLINTLSAEIQIGEGSARLWWEVTPNAATLCCDRLRPLRHRLQPCQLKWGWWGEFNYLEMKWDVISRFCCLLYWNQNQSQITRWVLIGSVWT